MEEQKTRITLLIRNNAGKEKSCGADIFKVKQ